MTALAEVEIVAADAVKAAESALAGTVKVCPGRSTETEDCSTG
jgi:hypothetical protein